MRSDGASFVPKYVEEQFPTVEAYKGQPLARIIGYDLYHMSYTKWG